jgi:leader peptidase (prepilin peptidase)/N-methyltransferase
MVGLFSVVIITITAAVASVWVAPGLHGTLGAILALLMLSIAVIDARHYVIPDELTATALCFALVNAGIDDNVLEGLAEAALRGMALAVVFFAVRAIFSRIRGQQAIGLGDVKLAGVAGAWLSWMTMPVAVEIAALAALAAYGLRHLIGGQPIRLKEKVPFGLFFAPSIWVCWLIETALFAAPGSPPVELIIPG